LHFKTVNKHTCIIVAMLACNSVMTDKSNAFNIVTYLLRVRTVESERQSLLANESEAIFVSRQQPQNKQRNDFRC
jgi:hypothetical protein